MNIALMPSAYRPAIGGVEELSRQLAINYTAQGRPTIVITNRWPRDLPEHEVLDGLDVYRLPFRLPHPSIKGRVSYPTTSRLIQRRLHRILERHSIDVMHVQCVSSNAHYALRAREVLGVPVVVTTQGELTMDPAQAFERDPVMIALMERALTTADAVTACSGKTLRDVEAFVGRDIPGAHVIHNGADLSAFDAAQPSDLGYPYVLALGRLVPQKGFDVLLRAWSALSVDGQRLVIAGEGPSRGDLERLIRQLGLDDQVVLFGAADRATVPALMKGATFVVVPSRADEGLPLVSVEAMAAGAALVVTRSGGVEEAITHGEHALIVERDDVDGLAHATQALLDGADLRARLGHAGRHRSTAFDWPHLAARYLSVLSSTSPTQPRTSLARGYGRAQQRSGTHDADEIAQHSREVT